MKTTVFTILSLVSLMFFSFGTSTYSQSLMTGKEIFFYTLRANNIKPETGIVYAGFSGSQTYQWIDFYASYFDNSNYLKSVKDEFKRVPYLTKIKNEMENGIKSVDFNKIFYYFVNATIGTYDANCGCFPLSKQVLPPAYRILDIKKVGTSELSLDGSFVSFKIGEYLNSDDFYYSLKMNSSDAEKFVDSRKDNYGNINRTVTLKVIYNVANKYIQNVKYVFFIGAYIHKLEFYNGSILLGSADKKSGEQIKIQHIKDSIQKIVSAKEEASIINNYSSRSWTIIATTKEYSNPIIQIEGKRLNWKEVGGDVHIKVTQPSGEISYFDDGPGKTVNVSYPNGTKYQFMAIDKDVKVICTQY